ncbi:unnamed protein product [Durusdinium trenchii]|uniref:Uncharacterized protein n=1 Tax=Durusdinium trenchii TaxID=1381693 RepID=A0ABP0MVJ5_9DINO
MPRFGLPRFLALLILRAFAEEECIECTDDEALHALQRRTSFRTSFDFHLNKTVTLTGLKNNGDFFDDVGDFFHDVFEGVRECLDESAQLRFELQFRFLVDTSQCQVEATLNTGSAMMTISTCGHFPVTATLFRGPGVYYDQDRVTFSSCAHDVMCADIRFLNKAGCNYNVWDVQTRARSEIPVRLTTRWITLVSNATLYEM